MSLMEFCSQRTVIKVSKQRNFSFPSRLITTNLREPKIVTHMMFENIVYIKTVITSGIV